MLKKVWAAEERSKAEQRTIEQLRREKAEERAIEESRRLQAQQGLVTSTPVERLEWMYAGQAMSEAVKQEQYLLGAAVKQVQVADSAAVTAAVAAADERWKRGDSGAVAAGSPSGSSLEAAARLREDPLVAIMREQQKRSQPAATRLSTDNRSSTTTVTQHSRGAESDRPTRGDGGGERSSRVDRHRDRRESGSVRGVGEEVERRGTEEMQHRRERRTKRARYSHQSHSSNSPNSDSSVQGDRESRRRRRRRVSRSRSRSGSRGRQGRSTQPHHTEDGRWRSSMEIATRVVRGDSSMYGSREQESVANGQRRDSRPQVARDERDRPAGGIEVTDDNPAAVSSTARPALSSAPSLLPSPFSSTPSVVSSAFVSSTSAFGGRLGLIVPAGAPSPLPPPNTAMQEESRQQTTHRCPARPDSTVTVPQVRSSVVTLVQPLPRPPLPVLTDAERAERLRAMQSDAESLTVSRSQRAAHEAAHVVREQSERKPTVDEVERLSAAPIKAM